MAENLIILTGLFIFFLIVILMELKRKNYKIAFLSFFISSTWVIYYGYNYKGNQLFLLGNINVFALVAWTLGLIVFAHVYDFFRGRYEKLNAIIYAGIVYWVGLLLGEYIGYNYIGIQLASSYSGLFGLALMHGTVLLKVYYLTVWLLFIGLLELIYYRR